MTLAKYVKSRGLTLTLVAQEMNVKKQMLSAYGNGRKPNCETLKRIANAMTTLGAETQVIDLVPLFIN